MTVEVCCYCYKPAIKYEQTLSRWHDGKSEKVAHYECCSPDYLIQYGFCRGKHTRKCCFCGEKFQGSKQAETCEMCAREMMDDDLLS